MTYSNAMREARYRIKERQQGNIITKWYRNVEVDDSGRPTGVITFEAFTEDDPGAGRCDLVWKSQVNADGELVQVYTCASAKCEGSDCVLQYSLDDKDWLDVTEAQQPPAGKNCYFRCRCGGPDADG
jgi:hypothetical protein